MHQNEEYKNLLRRAGLKATPSRLAVLALLRKAKRPLSAQSIIDIMNARTDQATIYRMLSLFKKTSIIRPIDFRHNHAHYELAIGRMKDHHHLICAHCGYSEDVPCRDMTDMDEYVIKNSRSFTKLTDHSLEFYGICKKCDKK